MNKNTVYQRFPDGNANWYIAEMPSPNKSNVSFGQLKFSKNAGFYNEPFYVNISSPIGDSIYYTLDGSIPTEESTLYLDSIFLNFSSLKANSICEVPTTLAQSKISFKAWEKPKVNIKKSHVLRCATYRDGILSSKIYTQTYFVEKDGFEKYSMPVISINTDKENLFN